MKKWLKFYWTWLMYCWAVQETKSLYYTSHARGYYCEGIRNGIAKYDVTKPLPKKSWMDFKEYKKRWHPTKGTEVLFVGPKISEFELLMRGLQSWRTP